MIKTLRLILGDQLSHNISALENIDSKHDIILMCEVRDECNYVKHHKKKIAFIFSAMRHFAEELQQKKYHISYTKFDDEKNSHSIIGEIKRAIKIYNPEKIIVTEPSEFRLLQELIKLQKSISLTLEIKSDQRFLATHQDFLEFAKNRKELRMEFFYRQMRVKYNILMDGKKPIGDKWNFDALNRKFPDKKISVPKPYFSKPDVITKEVLDLVKKNFANHFGDLEPFYFAINRKQALQALNLFINQRLEFFGDYQDAMIENEPWMFHSHLSFYLNVGLLEPLECVIAAQQAFFDKKVSLNCAEGFIRQILGWREYVRGIYWLKMPGYKKNNFLNATKKLPEFFWHGETKMNCLKQAINETKQNAYAHHIQRLMVIGNFALIAGIDPDLVNEWYLIVYADAFEWVELPNVTGMILFADAGILASKPYAASGAYIDKMSNYCKNCAYKVLEKSGENACPFNYLYWDFLIRNYQRLKNNQRLTMIYAALKKMSSEKIALIKKDAANFFEKLDMKNSNGV
ncbi:MAG: cryptochrome/photolyase family protein [Rickettsiales bacterium]|nr:cryptochrome/photolyase family protein [Rickettsiales bacterium]